MELFARLIDVTDPEDTRLRWLHVFAPDMHEARLIFDGLGLSYYEPIILMQGDMATALRCDRAADRRTFVLMNAGQVVEL